MCTNMQAICGTNMQHLICMKHATHRGHCRRLRHCPQPPTRAATTPPPCPLPPLQPPRQARSHNGPFWLSRAAGSTREPRRGPGPRRGPRPCPCPCHSHRYAILSQNYAIYFICNIGTHTPMIMHDMSRDSYANICNETICNPKYASICSDNELEYTEILLKSLQS